ncbi:hypothetical protein OE88DRAFT_510065 [Heliocybe sulcata]|uniref:Uncharacterized protein n=1 Tax=Heliocybe sulcata TaxID=5364 RepID=A0A5C3MVF4_9AGAM|nr:hypothetical protein OE88DRAFT_510065 [Heliocybe sulcata]
MCRLLGMKCSRNRIKPVVNSWTIFIRLRTFTYRRLRFVPDMEPATEPPRVQAFQPAQSMPQTSPSQRHSSDAAAAHLLKEEYTRLPSAPAVEQGFKHLPSPWSPWLKDTVQYHESPDSMTMGRHPSTDSNISSIDHLLDSSSVADASSFEGHASPEQSDSSSVVFCTEPQAFGTNFPPAGVTATPRPSEYYPGPVRHTICLDVSSLSKRGTDVDGASEYTTAEIPVLLDTTKGELSGAVTL